MVHESKWVDPTIDKIKGTVREVQDHLSRIKDKYNHVTQVNGRRRNSKGSTKSAKEVKTRSVVELPSTPNTGQGNTKGKPRSLGTARKTRAKLSKEAGAPSKRGGSKSSKHANRVKSNVSDWATDPRRLAIEGFLRRSRIKDDKTVADEKAPRSAVPEEPSTDPPKVAEDEAAVPEEQMPGSWAVDELEPGYELDEQTMNVALATAVSAPSSDQLLHAKTYDSWAHTKLGRRPNKRPSPRINHTIAIANATARHDGARPSTNAADERSLVAVCDAMPTLRISDGPPQISNAVTKTGDDHGSREGPRLARSSSNWYHNRGLISRRLEERRLCLFPNNLSLPEMEVPTPRPQMPPRTTSKSPLHAAPSATRMKVVLAGGRLGICGVEIENWNTSYRHSFSST